jgi:predicted RNA-binding protein with RPS1 domain
MVDLGSYKDKFADSGQRILEHALSESRRRDQNFVSVEHILQALTVEEPDMFNSAMRDLSLDPVVVKMAIEKRLGSSRQQHVGKGFRIGSDTTDLFKRAMERARTQGRKTIEATDIFEALSNEDSLFVDVLRTMGANPDAVLENVRAQVQKREQEDELNRKKFELPPYLKHFGVSLNRLARADKIAPTIGREKEIQQIIEILCHRERANSPMLTGEPGVGKTAVIEGLARLIELEPEKPLAWLRSRAIRAPGEWVPHLEVAIEDSYNRLLNPSIQTEVRLELKDRSDEEAIRVFRENLENLLLAPPAGRLTALAIDPGIRTGCKLAVVDGSGRYVGASLMHLESPAGQASAAPMLAELVDKGGIRAVAVGNGTAGRETETFVREALQAAGLDQVPVVMVSESGASVYSASDVAREEFPELDVTIRGAISIARRLQDPLAELVKIDPRSIGVGQYQHDVSPHALKKSLGAVIDSCVNRVGVNLNTASYHLLSHVSGIGPGLARAIVERRSNAGLFGSRAELLDIPRFSRRVFEQAAGFLRIPEAAHPLDNTGVHPERYEVLERLAARRGVPVSSLLGAGVTLVKEADELRREVGAFTFDDIVKELEKPGRDPRAGFVAFAYRQDIHAIQDLEPGMVCPGIVTNVTNFGAFVDIGVHQDGLVHISQLADRFVRDPREVVNPGDRVTVRVLQVKLDKNQIALTMKSERGQEQAEARRERPERPPRPSPPERPRARPAPGPAAGPPAKAPFNDAFASLAKLRRPV